MSPADPFTGPLPPLPVQPAGTPWPGAGPDGDWPEGDPPAGVDLELLLDQACDDRGPLARTHAVVVVHRGRVVAERYQGRLESFDRPPEPVGPTTPLLSWSMAKSMLHAIVGLLVADGRLDLHRPVAVPEWATDGDPRGSITLDQLLAMRDGLAFVEDYGLDEHLANRTSDVIEMLFGAGRDDVAHFAADRPLAAPPGERFNYSSGTSDIVSGIVARLVGPGDPYRRFLADRLFGPIGAASARPAVDEAGTWVASSYVHATARDFARFGLLYLRGGRWDGHQLLPSAWIDTARRARSVDPSDGQLHSNHWWVTPDGLGTFSCQGYEGQSITVCPAADLVLVRLGKTPSDRYPALRSWRADVVAAFAQAPS
ncbi:MAG TPA: serine hydrolase [Acidimicrobiales bacterium]|jgi:CubicO group peptidase (beta-lactamase class C family)|nr:serine hydrolase [Acidimicrobiales bacterium]